MIKEGDVVYLDKRGCFGSSYDKTLGLTNRLNRLEKNIKYVVLQSAYNVVRLKHNMMVYHVEHFKKYE